MKFNIEVDVDWLEEGGSVNEEVRGEIIHGVMRQINKETKEKISKAMDESLREAQEQAAELINAQILKAVDDWLNNEVVVTDKFGEPKDSGTLKDIIKREWSDVLNRRVDADGSFSGYGNKKYTVLEYLTNRRVTEVVEENLKSFSSEVNRKIKEEINKGIKNNVSDMFAQMVVGAAQQQYKDQQALESKTQ